MVELQSGLAEIHQAGAVLWAINYESPETLQKVKQELKLAFPLLSDSGAVATDLYEVRNKEKDGTNKEGVAKPTIFIVEQTGKVISSFAYENVGKRHSSQDIIRALQQ